MANSLDNADTIYLRNDSTEWGGLDTLIITAGVSTVRLFMDNVSSSTSLGASNVEHAPTTGLWRAKSIAQRALDANLFAPLVSAAAFVRFMDLSLTPQHLIL